MRSASDKIKREEVWRMMEELGINKNLIEGVKKMYKDTRCKIMIKEEIIGEFRTEKGVRQGCPLSPVLFNIAFADLEKEMNKEQEGGNMLGNKKLKTITYADDVVLIARNAEGLESLMERFKRDEVI